jgi:hypothetical protein
MGEVSEQDWLEQARRGIARPLTAVNLLDYALCPRKFLLSHFAPARQARALGATRALHSAVRGTLVACDQAGGPGAVSLEWLRQEFLRRFDGAACADSLEEEQTRRLGLRILADFQAQQRSAGVQVVGSDVRFAGRIEDLEFVGVADRVERGPQGELFVARYDVTRQPPGPQRLQRDFSMGLLVVLAEGQLGQRPWARLYALRKGKVYEVAFAEGQLERVRQRALSLARAIGADRQFVARPGDYCGWCRVRSACGVWQERRRSAVEAGGG